MVKGLIFGPFPVIRYTPRRQAKQHYVRPVSLCLPLPPAGAAKPAGCGVSLLPGAFTLQIHTFVAILNHENKIHPTSYYPIIRYKSYVTINRLQVQLSFY